MEILAAGWLSLAPPFVLAPGHTAYVLHYAMFKQIRIPTSGILPPPPPPPLRTPRRGGGGSRRGLLRRLFATLRPGIRARARARGKLHSDV
jgi:hypothetical protein